jgi:hypothetical protein
MTAIQNPNTPMLITFNKKPLIKDLSNFFYFFIDFNYLSFLFVNSGDNTIRH